jgi:hypothetical protein
MTMESRRIFVKSDQIAFAAVSRDFNPLHLDEVAARRTTFGRPVVHGMHIALWMLDWLAGTSCPPQPFRKLSVRFKRALFLDELAEIRSKRNGSDVEMVCFSGDALLTQMKLSNPGALSLAPWRPGDEAWSVAPEVLDIGGMARCAGELTLPYTVNEMAGLFPNALKVYGGAAVSHLVALTRIIGMEVPGLYSIFGGFSIELLGGSGYKIAYKTIQTNVKTSHVKLQVDSAVLAGTAESFVRPSSEMPDIGSVVQEVRPIEFSGRSSLIIGGSRGLGLVSAYLLSAGGADVVVTYRVGITEAERVVATIRSAGGKALAIPLDVAAPEAGLEALAKKGFQPTDVYYFATPHIFERKKALFEPALFDSFIKCYVTDFAGIIDACAALSSHPIRVFYPSSDALNHPLKELMEYTAAKAAGEYFCEMTSQFNPRIKVLIKRLPRLPTDQTATLIKIGTADPAQVMLRICREMGPS